MYFKMYKLNEIFYSFFRLIINYGSQKFNISQRQGVNSNKLINILHCFFTQ